MVFHCKRSLCLGKNMQGSPRWYLLLLCSSPVNPSDEQTQGPFGRRSLLTLTQPLKMPHWLSNRLNQVTTGTPHKLREQRMEQQGKHQLEDTGKHKFNIFLRFNVHIVVLDISTYFVRQMLLALQPGGHTETQSLFNSPQGRKAPHGTAGSSIWTHPTALKLRKAPWALSSVIAVGTSLHQVPVTGWVLSAP